MPRLKLFGRCSVAATIAVGLALLLLGCAGTAPLTHANLRASVLSKHILHEGPAPSAIGVTTRFSTQGYVYVLTVLTAESDALLGTHTRHYEWYANGTLLKATKPDRFELERSPHYLWSWEPTLAFGEGQHAVVLHLDGEPVDRLEFQVSKSTPGAELDP